jgi:predicted nucleotidyltransferase/DNA-binding transcriptional ArsR family regulator
MISLRSSLRRALFTYLYGNRSARFYVRQLAGELGVDPTNLSRELARLEKDGLLHSEVEGRQRYYTLNRNYPYLKPLFTMLQGSVGIVPALQAALGRVPAIEAAYLFGSFAKDEADASSDIDLLIIGYPDAALLASQIRGTEKTLRRDINYTVLGDRELRAKLKARDPFVADIWRGKRIALIDHAAEQIPAR